MISVRSSESASSKMSRRRALTVGALGLGGLTLADLNRLEAASRAARNDKAIILLWIAGGPSHLETYDMKPDAPSTVRSLFSPIRTKVPGMDVCELLPKHAAIADKFTLLRSVAHDEMDHGYGSRRFLTGYRDDFTRGENRRPLYPTVDSGVFRVLGGFVDQMPTSVVINPSSHVYRGPGNWGTQFDPPGTVVDHQSGRFGESRGLPGMTKGSGFDRLEDRRSVIGQLEGLQTALQSDARTSTWDTHQRRAFDLLSSSRIRNAFDLSREPEAVRAKYGRGAQDILLCRRLVESGVRLVNMYVNGKPPIPPYNQMPGMFNWDDHAVNWDIAQAMKMRLPWYDHIVSTLIDDLHQRGLDDKVMLIVTGEFGRSPRLEYTDGKVGRDHWCRAMSILVSGGGRKRGDIIGATNLHGEHPVSRRYDPHDFLATIYQYLGIDHQREFHDPTGRPIPLTRGEPIRELV